MKTDQEVFHCSLEVDFLKLIPTLNFVLNLIGLSRKGIT